MRSISRATSPEVRLVHCAIGLKEGAKVIWTALLSAGLRGAAVTKASLKQTGARTRAVSTRAARRVEAVASAPEQLYVSVERSRTSPQYCVGSSASQQLFRADDCQPRNTPQWAEGMFELAMHAACLPWGCFGYGPSRPTQAEVRHPWEPLHEGGGALRATKQRLRLGFASSDTRRTPTNPAPRPR